MPGRGRGFTRGGRGGRQSCGGLNGHFIPPLNDAYGNSWQANGLGSSQPYFSMGEEARLTERHHSWDSDLKLRHSRISFISAGTPKAEELTQSRQTKIEDIRESTKVSAAEKSKRTLDDSARPPIVTPEIPMSEMSLGDILPVRTFESKSKPTLEAKSRSTSPHSQIGYGGGCLRMPEGVSTSDFRGSGKPVHTRFPPPAIRRSNSPVTSESSEEVVLFAGRNSKAGAEERLSNSPAPTGVGGLRGQLQSKAAQKSRQPKATVVNDPVSNILVSPSLSRRRTPPNLTTPSHLEIQETSPPRAGRLVDIPGSEVGTGWRKRRRRGRGRGKGFRKAEEEAEIWADYIKNTCEGDHLNGFAESSALDIRELGGSDHGKLEDEEDSMSDAEVNGGLPKPEERNSADLRNFDQLSTSSEALDAIQQVLSKRERPSGMQYLVVRQESTVDDARWLPLAALDVPGAEENIQIYEEVQAEFERLWGGSDDPEESFTTDVQLSLDLQEEMEEIKDEKNLKERRKDRMTDEQMARSLSKQEELGMESDDLKLFNGFEFGEEDLLEPQLDGAWEGASNVQSRSRATRRKRAQPRFSAVTSFANVLEQDQLNSFDVMDQGGPSLRNTPRGRRGKQHMELSDSILEQKFQLAWEKDRSKKRIRKQEREELRAQGLLGKTGKPDIKAKYKEGMSMTEVKNEIKGFLLSSTESLSLPPMAQQERKMVHEIANVFGLKSKSMGKGTSRFPILYRTTKTEKYDEDALEIIEGLLSSRRFLPRIDKGKKKARPLGKGRGGGFASGSVSYRDGEIVGAMAPELGQENKGRAMLEKMGWSTGNTLGALNNNRGIVQPVAQVIKTGKAGLG